VVVASVTDSEAHEAAEDTEDTGDDDSDDSDYVPDEDEEDSLYVSEDEAEDEDEEDEQNNEDSESNEGSPEYVSTIALNHEQTISEILQRELTVHVKIPTWVPLAGITAILSYLWVVGFVTGRC
jgi:hypothetical protein